MQILTKKEALMPLLNRVGGVVERRQTLPVLGNLLISATEQLIEVVGTDLEVEVRSRLPANVESPGEITVPARKMIDIWRALPEGGDVAFRVEKDRAMIRSGRSRFALSTLPASDFPLMEGAAGDLRIELQQRQLKSMLERTAFAMAHQDVRYYLNGLLLEVHEDRLVAVATDGHRLAKVEEELAADVEGVRQVILPRKTVIELARLLVGSESAVQIDLSEKGFRACVEETVLTSKLVDGRYPDYSRVIPLGSDKVARVSRDGLRQALLRTSILSNEKYKGVRLEFGSGSLRVQAHNPEQDEAEEELEIEYDGQAAALGFNVGYLLDVLSVLPTEVVQIAFSDSNSSALLSGDDQDRDVFVVMPLRL
jgi:DNA polymerase-3 subunit beta